MQNIYKTNASKVLNGFNLYVGPYPDLYDLIYFKLENFDCIWNLAHEASSILIEEKQHVSCVLFSDIKNNEPPSGKEFIDQLNMVVDLLKDGKRVYVHAFSNSFRTNLVIDLIKIKLGLMTKEDINVNNFEHNKKYIEDFNV